MKCNGKCYLAKKLREQEKEQSPSSGNQKISPVIQLFFAEAKFELTNRFGNTYQTHYQPYNDLQTVRTTSCIFHPPNS